MPQEKILAFLFGSAVGLAIAAIVIGLILSGTGVVVALQAGAATSVLEHPLHVSGSELVLTGLLSGLPLSAVWYFWLKK